MIDLDNTVKNGFDFNKRFNMDTDIGLAFISLKIALKAYFSTYQTFKAQLNIFNNSEITPEEIDYNHRNSYCEASAETIVHFQHFAELVCKKILKDKDGLLSLYKQSSNGDLFFLYEQDNSIKIVIKNKLDHNIELTLDEQESLFSIPASQVIKKLVTLSEGNRLNDLGFDFSIHKKTCEKLNYLRNSMLHKGVFILRYPALDTFVGRHILPFVLDVLKSPYFSSNNTYLWKYKNLHCEIDPIEEIITASQLSTPDIGKLALLKELGRASYKSPLSALYKKETSTPLDSSLSSRFDVSGISKYIDKKEVKRAERIAQLEVSQGYFQIKICPVCGIESLILYDDTDYEYSNNSDEVTSAYNYTYMVKCECCTFNLESQNVKNASEYGFSNIDDYWIVKSE